MQPDALKKLVMDICNKQSESQNIEVKAATK